MKREKEPRILTLIWVLHSGNLIWLKELHLYYRSPMAIRMERWNDLDLLFHIFFAK